MYNKCFEYLLSNDPKKVLSEKGVRIRKKINPLFLKLVPLTTKNKLTIEEKKEVPTDRPIIYAATHGFRDDIAFTLMTIGKHVYLLYGSIPDFYQSLDGVALWANGSIIVDRKDRESRNASMSKMEYAIDLSADILMYPEGVWNKDPVNIVQKLYTGIYKLAKSKNALVVPLATILEGNKGYSLQGSAYDITKIDYDKYELIIKKLKNNIEKIIDLILYNDPKTEVIKEKAQNVLVAISNIELSDTHEEYEDKIKYLIALNKDILDYVLKTFNKEYWTDKYIKDNNIGNIEIEKSIIERIIILLKDSVEAEARICTDDLRDKMATLKWQLISEHCQVARGDFRKYDPVSKYWEKYLEELIKTANGLYDYEIENVAHYVDKTQYSEEDVYGVSNSNNKGKVKIRKSR